MLNAYETASAMPDARFPEHEARIEAPSFTLRRAGKRPLRFEGTELCMAMSFVPGMPFWYEIGVFRTVQQQFVVAVKKFYTNENETDIVHAWECESFADAMDVLEGFDAAVDVRADATLNIEKLSAAELAAHGYMLHARVADARHHYASLVGELLHTLEQG